MNHTDDAKRIDILRACNLLDQANLHTMPGFRVSMRGSWVRPKYIRSRLAGPEISYEPVPVQSPTIRYFENIDEFQSMASLTDLKNAVGITPLYSTSVCNSASQ